MSVPPQNKVTWGKVENGGPYVIMHLSYFPPDGETVKPKSRWLQMSFENICWVS